MIRSKLFRLFPVIVLNFMTVHLNAMQIPSAQIQQEGPLAKLGFEPLSTDSEGRIIGWLTIPDFLPATPGGKEATLIRVQPHAEGYSISFVTPEGRTLPLGLFYWYSTKKVSASHPDGYDYIYIVNPKEPRDGTWFEEEGYKKDQLHHTTTAAVFPQMLPNAFEYMPSIVKAFGGEHGVYLWGTRAPKTITLTPEIINLAKKYYSSLNEQEKKNILSFYSQDDRTILTNWLMDKIKHGGYSPQEQRELIEHYLIEILTWHARHLAENKQTHGEFSLNQTLSDIDSIIPCTNERRMLFNKQMLEERSEHRRKGITAYSKITCVGGIYEWD